MIYNPLDTFYKSQIGAVNAKETITFRVKGNFDSVVFVCNKDGENCEKSLVMNKFDTYFQVEVSFETGLYFYYFKLNGNSFIGLSENYTGEIFDCQKPFQLTACDNDYAVPSWINGGVIYQIFPDRFYRGEKDKTIEKGKILHQNWLDTPVYLPNENGKIINNDFFGGDLNGIQQKLDYLKSLGVTAIYLNPIFKAFSNHRYDTGNYLEIDSLLGTIEDFKNLIEKANDYGIKIILDGVFNHTGDDSVYFNKYGNYQSVGAYQDKNSEYYKWYNFTEYPNEYESWWGITTLPAINESNSEYVNFITGKDGVLEHYTKMGIGGWRLDVVDELPSHFVEKIRQAVKGVNKQAIVIGEVWEDVSNKISYGVRRKYFQGKELDSAMNYPLKEAIIKFVKYKDAYSLAYLVKEQIDHYPKKALDALMNIISTHDTPRLLTVVGGEEPCGKSKTQLANLSIPKENMPNAIFKLKVASLLQYTLCGVPSLYYGDEAGMQGYADPLNRTCYPWGQEDKELIKWYQKLGQIRKTYSAFKNGEYQEIFVSDGIYIFKRFDKKSEVMIAVNLSEKDVDLQFNGKLYDLVLEEEFVNSFTLNQSSVAIMISID